jgi:hypothetical protein
MTPKPETAVDRWNHAVHVAFAETPDDLADEVLAMTDAEVDAELRAAGFDLDEVDAEGAAIYARLFGAKDA